METQLKVKLEDIVLLGESITKLSSEVYGLHKKIVYGQEPKTPTKEQIDYIAKVIFVTNKEEPVTDLQYECLCQYWDRTVKKDTKRKYRARAKIAIETWEKIRGGIYESRIV